MSKASVKVGDVFETNTSGKCVVIDYANAFNVTVRFILTGFQTICQADNIRRGKVKDPYFPNFYGVGFIGEGTYRSEVDHLTRKEYSIWQKMLKRCYTEIRSSSNESYDGCSVTKDWHNFQNFAKWYNEQPNAHKEHFEIDKDIIKKGNKVYCPEFCDLVPKVVNMLLVNRKKLRGELPIGVCWSKEKQKYQVGFKNAGVNKFVGRYDGKEQAFEAYKTAKEIHIKNVAEEHRDVLRPETYRALMNWQIEIDD